MTSTETKSVTQKLADIVRQKAEAARTARGGVPGRGSSERAAAALSASKAKPAPRKG